MNNCLYNMYTCMCVCVLKLVGSHQISPSPPPQAQPTPSSPMFKKTRIALLEEDNSVIEVLPGSSLKEDQQNLTTASQEFPSSPPSSPPPPEQPARRDSQSNHSVPSLPPAPYSPASSCTHLSITRANIDPLFRPPSPPPQIPPHLKDLQVSPAASTETFRADFETQDGSNLLPSGNDDDPIISGEFVLIRQTIDDTNSPKVKQDTEMMIPVPLHATACLGDGPLIGPGVCRVTTECRQQTLLDGHFKLRRSGANRSRAERRVRKKTEEEEGSEMVPPEPPQRTTSLRSSTSTLASIATLRPQRSAQSPTTSFKELLSVPLYVANPLAEQPIIDPFSVPPCITSQSLNFTSSVNNNLPLTPIPEMSQEFSLRSSIASTAATGPIGSSNGSISRSVNRWTRETQPVPIRPPSSLRSSLETNGLDLLTEINQARYPNSPSSFGSSSLNEFLRLEEQESISDELEKQLMEGLEGDRSLVEAVIGDMRTVEEGEEGVDTSSLSRSLGPSILLGGGTDSISMLSSTSIEKSTDAQQH
uniref:RING-type domain-containing protein n=1 Tax=Rodentolepis nana TaxID=102285 RepID=A0A0R3TTL9_RODNA